MICCHDNNNYFLIKPIVIITINNYDCFLIIILNSRGAFTENNIKVPWLSVKTLYFSTEDRGSNTAGAISPRDLGGCEFCQTSA
jgi:hypothetical protein